ncbi:RNA polymerase sigma factor, sigma-70 family [bacterium A37T11]|nr:RNA polymerase sigma factor, sigma-70 family [bacterium A37T11]
MNTKTVIWKGIRTERLDSSTVRESRANTAPLEERELKLLELYKKAFPMVASYIGKMGGDEQEAKDIFQDALVIFYEKVLTVNTELHYSEKSYLFGISKNLWNHRFREQNRKVPFDALEEFAEENMADSPAYEEASSAKLLNLLETAGQKCLSILSAFYYEKLSMEKLASRFGFRSTHSATVQKYKCLEKVKETVKENALHYEDFIE